MTDHRPAVSESEDRLEVSSRRRPRKEKASLLLTNDDGIRSVGLHSSHVSGQALLGAGGGTRRPAQRSRDGDRILRPRRRGYGRAGGHRGFSRLLDRRPSRPGGDVVDARSVRRSSRPGGVGHQRRDQHGPLGGPLRDRRRRPHRANVRHQRAGREPGRVRPVALGHRRGSRRRRGRVDAGGVPGPHDPEPQRARPRPLGPEGPALGGARRVRLLPRSPSPTSPTSASVRGGAPDSGVDPASDTALLGYGFATLTRSRRWRPLLSPPASPISGAASGASSPIRCAGLPGGPAAGESRR